MDGLMLGVFVIGFVLVAGVVNVLFAIAEHRRAQAQSVLRHAGLLADDE